MKIDKLKIGSLNVQGMNDPWKQESIKKDLDRYELNILAVQETKTRGISLESITTKQGRTFSIFQANSNNNKYQGTALFIENSLSPEFKAVSDRMCMATIKLETNKMTIINVYAPTEQRSKDHPEEREKFYQELEQLINNTPNRDFILIAGDFNAKVGRRTEYSEDVVGNYAKGSEKSENGQQLIELCYRNNLKILNTVFKHKMAHRTTWTSNQKPTPPRRNVYRNQIDYILIRSKHLSQAEDARSYGGIETSTDHKLVKASLKIKWCKVKYNKPEI